MSGGYQFDVVDPGDRLRRFKGALDDSRWILVGIGALLEAASSRAFREERMGDVKWKTRAETDMVPNWPAILAHFSQKATPPPPRNLSAKETLMGTGRLAGSMKSRVVTEDTVQIGTNVPYGEALHRGDDTETVMITKALQGRMWAWMKKLIGRSEKTKQMGPFKRKRKTTKLSRAQARLKKAIAKHGADSEEAQKVKGSVARASADSQVASKLGRLLNKNLRGKKLTVSHPARPLVGVPDDIRDEIKQRYGVRVRRVG